MITSCTSLEAPAGFTTITLLVFSGCFGPRQQQHQTVPEIILFLICDLLNKLIVKLLSFSFHYTSNSSHHHDDYHHDHHQNSRGQTGYVNHDRTRIVGAVRAAQNIRVWWHKRCVDERGDCTMTQWGCWIVELLSKIVLQSVRRSLCEITQRRMRKHTHTFHSSIKLCKTTNHKCK